MNKVVPFLDHATERLRLLGEKVQAHDVDHDTYLHESRHKVARLGQVELLSELVTSLTVEMMFNNTPISTVSGRLIVTFSHHATVLGSRLSSLELDYAEATDTNNTGALTYIQNKMKEQIIKMRDFGFVQSDIDL